MNELEAAKRKNATGVWSGCSGEPSPTAPTGEERLLLKACCTGGETAPCPRSEAHTDIK